MSTCRGTYSRIRSKVLTRRKFASTPVRETGLSIQPHPRGRSRLLLQWVKVLLLDRAIRWSCKRWQKWLGKPRKPRTMERWDRTRRTGKSVSSLATIDKKTANDWPCSPVNCADHLHRPLYHRHRCMSLTNAFPCRWLVVCPWSWGGIGVWYVGSILHERTT